MNGYSRYDILFDEKTKTTPEEDISLFFSNPLWIELDNCIKSVCGAKPELSYILYASQRHWNVQYNNDGRNICILYPEGNTYIAMIDISIREEKAVQALLPDLTCYVQLLYENTCATPLGRWLVIKVTDKKILRDVQKLLKIRMMSSESGKV